MPKVTENRQKPSEFKGFMKFCQFSSCQVVQNVNRITPPDWLSSAGVMLEIAYPMMIGNLVLNGFQANSLGVCTNWNKIYRKQADEMARLCGLEGMHQINVLHPVKPDLEMLDSTWIKWFDKMIGTTIS